MQIDHESVLLNWISITFFFSLEYGVFGKEIVYTSKMKAYCLTKMVFYLLSFLLEVFC